MDEAAFDRDLIAGAFRVAGREGWGAVSAAAAAREAGLALETARVRFASREAILARFGEQADAAALTGRLTEGSVRERLFDLLMRRFDALQAHREGVRALLHTLPAHPATAATLAAGTLRSMGWMLEGAGLPATGLHGVLRAQGLLAVWLYAVRAWMQDDSTDLSATMAALDRALERAGQFGAMVDGGSPQREAAPGRIRFPSRRPRRSRYSARGGAAIGRGRRRV